MRWAALACTLFVAACGPAAGPPPEPPPPTPTATPPAATATAPAPLSEPPPSGITPDAPFPKISHATLASGLPLRVVERHNLPIVEIQLVVKTGTAGDEGRVGTALLAGEMLKAGGTGDWTSRQLLERVEGLGSSINVYTSFDTTRIELAVLTEHFDAAADILGKVVTRPRFSPVEFRKLKQREIERVQSSAKTSGGWGGAMMLYRELYDLPTAIHPYSSYDATPKQLKAVTLAQAKKWHQVHVTPKNAVLIVAGDVTPAQAKTAAERALSKWTGEAPSRPDFGRPTPRAKRQVYLVDRPGSTQADIYVGMLGPERRSEAWAPLQVVNQILGGGVSGRLFLDVREERSLAYRTGSRVRSLAHGPVPITLSAGTQTAKAGLTVKALLEHLQRINREAPSAEEIETATRYLSDVFLLRMERVGAIASMTADLAVWGLDDTYYDAYRKTVRGLGAADAQQSAKRYFIDEKALIVVAGDAKRIDKPLSHFAEVVVVDPTADFKVKRKLPHAPQTPIELERVDGT